MLRVHRSVLLGLVQGAAELVPVSSSGHVAAMRILLGWDEEDAELRKAEEVALHAGTALALVVALRREVGEAAHGLDARRVALLGLGSAPAALAALAFERPVERRLGGPRSLAAGLLAGSLALVVADRAPQVRGHEEAGAVDGLWLGLAQACALVPGVSRNGATLAAARARGFRRADANRLSRHLALPIIAGATALKGVRLAQRGADVRPLAAGALAACAASLASLRLLRVVERDAPLWPWAVERTVLAAVLLARETVRR